MNYFAKVNVDEITVLDPVEQLTLTDEGIVVDDHWDIYDNI